MKVYAPGKLILSGEHAVVHGCPALAIAVDRYAVASVTHQNLPNVLFELSNLAHRSQFSLTGIRDLKNRIKKKYQRFVHGDLHIRDVIENPYELAQFACALLTEKNNFRLPHGVKLYLESTIPLGCGMGSSAATILSVLYAMSLHFDQGLSHQDLYALALQAESMQHGKTSGLDVHVSMRGGCVYYASGEIYSRLNTNIPLFMVNTGTPDSMTGQCVSEAARYFESNELLVDFTQVTEAVDRALQAESIRDLKTAIMQNHELLKHIGVVPAKVSQFIASLAKQDIAAKICGAGAVKGDKAGVVLVITDDVAALDKTCQQFGYVTSTINIETRGLHVI